MTYSKGLWHNREMEVRILWTLSGARKDWSYGISSSITTLDNDTQCIPCFTVEKESGRTKSDSRVGKEVLIWRVWNECPTWSYFGETLEFEGGKWSIDQMQRPTGDWSHLGRDEFMLQFPNFHLEDKVSWGGGIVRPLVIHTYQRKGKRGIAEKGESGDAAKLGREGEGNQRGVYEGFSGNLFGVWWNWSLWNFWEREALLNQPLSFLIVILFYVLVLILFLFRYIRTIVILIVLFFLVISNFQKLWKYSGICLVGYFSRAGWRYLTKTKLSTEVRVWPWMLCFKLWFVL